MNLQNSRHNWCFQHFLIDDGKFHIGLPSPILLRLRVFVQEITFYYIRWLKTVEHKRWFLNSVLNKKPLFPEKVVTGHRRNIDPLLCLHHLRMCRLYWNNQYCLWVKQDVCNSSFSSSICSMDEVLWDKITIWRYEQLLWQNDDTTSKAEYSGDSLAVQAGNISN